MTNRTYNLAAGTVLLAAAVCFFIMPAALDYDAFIPVILGIVSLVSALTVLLRGASDE